MYDHNSVVREHDRLIEEINGLARCLADMETKYRALVTAVRLLLADRADTDMGYEEAYNFVFKLPSRELWDAVDAALPEGGP